MSDTARGSRVGSQVGPYYLKRLLGSGGMGEVYEAEDTLRERAVALKLLSETSSRDPEFRARLKREARTAGQLQEPHVVPIHNFGEIDGQLFIDMRLIAGSDLYSLLKRFGPLTPPRSVAIISQVASALDAAHAAGVMHRDVKPENILITSDDFAYLVDFGIASASTDERLTKIGTLMGTWRYMAPERFTSETEVTYRADIYALACVLFECLTGVPPYRANSIGEYANAHLNEPVPRPSEQRPGLPRGFDEVIARGMAKRPEDRYATAGDLARAAHQELSTPDQHRAVSMLKDSHESTLPNLGAEQMLSRLLPAPPAPAAPNPPPRVAPPAAPAPFPSSRAPAPQPTITPQPAPAWSPANGGPMHPPPNYAGAVPFAHPVGAAWPWTGQPGGAGGQWGQPNTAPGNRRLWLLFGAPAVLALVAVVVLVTWLVSPDPDLQAVGVTDLDDGVLVGSSAAPTTIDVFDEPICPACGTFIRSSSADMQQAVDDRKIAIRYHLLDFLDENSASKNYSTRAVAASYCVAAAKDPKVYQDFYAGLFAADFQPREMGTSDPSDDELANLADKVGAPASVSNCISSQEMMNSAKSKAAQGWSTLKGLSATTGTPAVFNGTEAVDASRPGWVESLG